MIPARERADVAALKGWLPFDRLVAEGLPYLRWLDFAGVELSEPFFEQTVERVRSLRPREVLTDLDALIELEKQTASIAPKGFIFHTSRCGSTLISNSLRVLDDSIVVSEAQALESLSGFLQSHSGEASLDALLRRVYLKACVNIFGQLRRGDERRYFVKFASPSVLQLGRIRKIWPDVPCVFVYRDPVEVIVSNVKKPGGWVQFETNPSMTAEVAGACESEMQNMSLEEFCARAFGRFCSIAAEQSDERMMLVNYEELSVGKLLEVARFFGVAPTELEATAIGRASRLYAKDAVPSRRFVDDAAEKRLAASSRVREMSERWALEAYQRLESIRLSERRGEALQSPDSNRDR
jgi:hypothetical protein